MASLFKETSYN